MLIAALLALTLQQAPQSQFGTIEGIVTKAGSPGTLIAGAHVKVSERPQMPMNSPPFTAETTTDETGRCRTTNVPAGTYVIEIWHENFGPRRPDQLLVTAGQVVRLSEISLATTARIRSRPLQSGHSRTSTSKTLAINKAQA
jgi:hypothetical protein